PDRIIVGECRGGEALDMLQAMNTGHEGSLTTVHANNPDDALSRLETLASMSDVEVPFHALRDQVNSAIDIIVQLNRLADGSRRVVDVSWVRSRRQEEFDLVPLMQYAIDRTDPAKPQGRFDVYDLPAPLRQRLTEGGADLSLVEVA
ncbi:MAG TPA: ATPase, T2SS/T4P/T4SS family, partial [Ornithinibacter sp.]|nr:ATPase, T2SS/T4P/T4SS family [Ornithinibacter sp.]